LPLNSFLQALGEKKLEHVNSLWLTHADLRTWIMGHEIEINTKSYAASDEMLLEYFRLCVSQGAKLIRNELLVSSTRLTNSIQNLDPTASTQLLLKISRESESSFLSTYLAKNLHSSIPIEKTVHALSKRKFNETFEKKIKILKDYSQPSHTSSFTKQTINPATFFALKIPEVNGSVHSDSLDTEEHTKNNSSTKKCIQNNCRL